MSALTDAATAASDLAKALTELDPLQVAQQQADAAEAAKATEVTTKATDLVAKLQAANVKTA